MNNPRLLLILRRLLPSGFVERVVEPSFGDLRAELIEKGEHEIDLPTSIRFVLACVLAAASAWLRQPRVVRTTLALLLLASIAIARLRFAY